MKYAAIFLVLVTLLVGHALFYYRALGWDAVDDAYISYVYARNAVLGHGLTFNPSERVEGFTNFMWTALMTPIVGIGADVGRVSSALGVAFAFGILWLVIRLARVSEAPSVCANVVGEETLGVWAGWLAALLLVADGSFALWSVSGLETALFAFLITLSAFLYVRENFETRNSDRVSPIKIPTSGIILALAAMTRPEAAAVMALTVAHQAAWRIVDQRRLFTRSDLFRAGSFAALFIPYWLVRWRYYHSFLPNSFYAKVAPGGPSAQIERGWEHVQQFVGVHLGWWILIPAVIAVGLAIVQYVMARRNEILPNAAANPASVRYRVFAFTYFALLIVAYGAYIVYVGGDWSVGRFFVPILPFVYLLLAFGLDEIIQFILRLWSFVVRPSSVVRRPSSVVVILGSALALALVIASSWNGEYRIFIGGFDAARATEARIAMGKWLKVNVPPGTWIAVDAAGQVPYFSELPTIDMFGINDLHIGRLPVATLGQGTPGHEKFDLGYIIARAPRYVIIYGTLFDSVSEYRRAPVEWTGDEALKSFLTLYERRRTNDE